VLSSLDLEELKKHPLGYLFAQSLFAFLAMMSLVLVPSIFALLVVINGALFVYVIENMTKEAL
jgi:hypothetical protein